MRVIILTNNQGNQKALCAKIAGRCEVAAIVLSQNVPRKKPSLAKKAAIFANKAAGRTIGRELVNAWLEMQRKYDGLYADFPTGNLVNVNNVNDPATLEAIEKYNPDLVVVSGTNLVGRKVIEAAQKRRGIVNLHTGISPYLKGGPNCTNWCLAKNWFHLIGNTVMWLDLGIDTGNIIATEQTPLDGNESLSDLHWKVMEHAHELYTKAIARIARGETVLSVPQNTIAEGSHFNTVDWNAVEMRNALANFRRNYKKHFADRETRDRLSAELKIFPLTDE